MTERKFTDEEVIRALECLAGAEGSCIGCIYQSTPFPTCRELVARQALDLINRQRAEIAALVSAVDNSTKEFLKLHDDYQDQKAEIERLQKYNTDVAFKHYNDGIKEFAERLKEKMNNLSRMEYHCDPYFLVSKDFIDKTAKELTEGKPCAEDADCSTEEGKG